MKDKEYQIRSLDTIAIAMFVCVNLWYITGYILKEILPILIGMFGCILMILLMAIKYKYKKK